MEGDDQSSSLEGCPVVRPTALRCYSHPQQPVPLSLAYFSRAKLGAQSLQSRTAALTVAPGLSLLLAEVHEQCCFPPVEGKQGALWTSRCAWSSLAAPRSLSESRHCVAFLCDNFKGVPGSACCPEAAVSSGRGFVYSLSPLGAQRVRLRVGWAPKRCRPACIQEYPPALLTPAQAKWRSC